MLLEIRVTGAPFVIGSYHQYGRTIKEELYVHHVNTRKKAGAINDFESYTTRL